MFKFEDAITREEKAVIHAMVVGVEKNGKVVRATATIEDGTKKGINEMLYRARENRGEASLKDLNDSIRAREVAAIRKDKEAKGKI